MLFVFDWIDFKRLRKAKTAKTFSYGIYILEEKEIIFFTKQVLWLEENNHIKIFMILKDTIGREIYYARYEKSRRN